MLDEWANLSEYELANCFDDLFYHELESWFSADIACCDYCYNDFVKKWPAVYLRDSEFQRSSIDIDLLYSGTRLQDFFTEDEYMQLIKNIVCPRCGRRILNNIWPYNLSFILPENFESEIEALDRISQKTPFLLLSHPFAKKFFDVINDLSHKTIPQIINRRYYRARKMNKKKEYTRDDFMYPPRNKISEGRYNHAGFPVLYLADEPLTCFYEMRCPSEGVAIAEIRLLKPIKILDLFCNDDNESDLLIAAAWSELLSSSEEGEGWYKPQYTFTRFIADCALNAGFDAIKYPSVRRGNSHNIVLLDGINGWNNIEVINIIKRKFNKIIIK